MTFIRQILQFSFDSEGIILIKVCHSFIHLGPLLLVEIINFKLNSRFS